MMTDSTNNVPDNEYVYNALLRCNYFPMVKEHLDEIPPIFRTVEFTPAIADSIIKNCNQRKSGYDQIDYKTTRFNNVSRFIQIPHPLPYAHLCKCIMDNWDKLDHICTNPLSQIKPEKHDDDRLIVQGMYDCFDVDRIVIMKNKKFPEDLMMLLEKSLGCKYYIEADISSCFSSIYTHSIPWALVGHEVAKANTNANIWYNKLDKKQRWLKRNETMGIPIGPATSNIISEIILYKIDELLLEQNFRFVRFIDDYKGFCESQDECERFILILENALKAYLLNLNSNKVIFGHLPKPRNDAWVIELNNNYPHDEKPSAVQITNYLDYAINLQNKYVHGSVLKYAARSLASKINDETVDIYLKYLSSLSYHYPVLLPILSEVANKHCCEINVRDILPVIKRQIMYNRSDAICWCLFIIGQCKMEIDGDLADDIIKTRDCMAIASLAATNQHTDKVINFINSLNKDQDFDLDKYWLLIYEFADDAKFDRYLEESGLKYLKDQNVQFLFSIDSC
jgi:hypothetical protein